MPKCTCAPHAPLIGALSILCMGEIDFEYRMPPRPTKRRYYDVVTCKLICGFTWRMVRRWGSKKNAKQICKKCECKTTHKKIGNRNMYTTDTFTFSPGRDGESEGVTHPPPPLQRDGVSRACRRMAIWSPRKRFRSVSRSTAGGAPQTTTIPWPTSTRINHTWLYHYCGFRTAAKALEDSFDRFGSLTFVAFVKIHPPGNSHGIFSGDKDS